MITLYPALNVYFIITITIREPCTVWGTLKVYHVRFYFYFFTPLHDNEERIGSPKNRENLDGPVP